MIVSQFSIGNNSHHGVATHHRLLLTNLSASAYFFRITLRSHYHNLQNLVVYSVERQSSFMMNQFDVASTHRFRGRSLFSVQPNETVRIQLRPFDVSAWQSPQNSMQAFGHLELTIPEVAKWGGLTEPQGDQPVNVLLHAFQIDWTAQGGFREPGAVSIGSGQAENKIHPDQPSKFQIGDMIEIFKRDGDTSAQRKSADAQMEDTSSILRRPQTLATVLSFLGRLEESPENLEDLNGLLREQGHDIRLQR